MKNVIDLVGEVIDGKPRTQSVYDPDVMQFVKPATGHTKKSFRECADRIVHMEYYYYPQYPDFLALIEFNAIPPALVLQLEYIFYASDKELRVKKCRDLFWGKDNPFLFNTDYPYILLPSMTETPIEWEYVLTKNVHVHCSSLVSVRYDNGIKQETLFVLRDISCKYKHIFNPMTTVEYYVAGLGLQDSATQVDE